MAVGVPPSTETPAPLPAVAVPADMQQTVVRALRNGLKLGGSLMFTWAIALGIRIIIPRHLGPARFGLLTFADTFSATGALLLSLGVDTYIRKEVVLRTEHASDFFGGIAVLRVAMQVLLFGGVVLGLHFTHRPAEVMLAAGVFSVARLFESFNGTLSAMLHAKSEIDGAAVLAVATKVVWAGGILVAVHFDTGLWVYAASFLASEAVETFVLYALAHRHLGLHMELDRSGTREALIGSLPFYVATVAQGVYSRLDITILSFFTGSREVGLYSAAFTVGALTMMLAPLFSWLVTPMFSQAAHRSEGELGVLVGQVLELLAVTAVPLSLATALGASVWLGLFFGDAFLPGVSAMYALAAMYTATYAGMALAAALAVTNRGWVATRVMLIGVAVDIVLNFVLIPLAVSWGGKDSGAGGIACGLSVTISEVVIAVLMMRPLAHVLPLARMRTLLLRTVLVVTAVVGIHMLLRPLLGNMRLWIDAVAYVGLALVTRILRPHELMDLARSIARQKKGP